MAESKIETILHLEPLIEAVNIPSVNSETDDNWLENNNAELMGQLTSAVSNDAKFIQCNTLNIRSE